VCVLKIRDLWVGGGGGQVGRGHFGIFRIWVGGFLEKIFVLRGIFFKFSGSYDKFFDLAL